jgi:hypothetical protein
LKKNKSIKDSDFNYKVAKAKDILVQLVRLSCSQEDIVIDGTTLKEMEFKLDSTKIEQSYNKYPLLFKHLPIGKHEIYVNKDDSYYEDSIYTSPYAYFNGEGEVRARIIIDPTIYQINKELQKQGLEPIKQYKNNNSKK